MPPAVLVAARPPTSLGRQGCLAPRSKSSQPWLWQQARYARTRRRPVQAGEAHVVSSIVNEPCWRCELPGVASCAGAAALSSQGPIPACHSTPLARLPPCPASTVLRSTAPFPLELVCAQARMVGLAPGSSCSTRSEAAGQRVLNRPSEQAAVMGDQPQPRHSTLRQQQLEIGVGAACLEAQSLFIETGPPAGVDGLVSLARVLAAQ